MCLICERIEKIKTQENPYFVKELTTGYVVIADIQPIKGYCLFLSKIHANELFELDANFCADYLREMTLVAKAMKICFSAEKMNYELLGNGDSHLHWHLFPRVAGDIGSHGMNGKGPVWWIPKEEMYGDRYLISLEELEIVKKKLLVALDQTFC